MLEHLHFALWPIVWCALGARCLSPTPGRDGQ